MISDIRIYHNNAWLSIIDKVENVIQLQGRADEAFALGSFKAWLDIRANIAPYTPLIIERDSNNLEYLMCKSRANKYLTQTGLWVHEITVMEATSVLACFILGSKNFGVTGNYKKDFYKIVILKELMEHKYPIFLNFNNFHKLDMIQEFTFGKGTTLFDALVEIVKTYDKLPKVTSYSYESIVDKWVYNIEFIDLSGGSEYLLDESKLLSVVYDQDSDNYCNRLEAEMDNVIDRTDIATVENLSFRSNDTILNEDDLLLVLPTKIEEIKSFKVNTNVQFSFNIVDIPFEYFKYSWEDYERIYHGIEQARSLAEWLLLFDGDVITTLINQFSEKIGVDILYSWKFYATGSKNVSLDLNWAEEIVIEKSFELSNFALPKSQYDALEPKDKVFHTYYESGGKTIQGFNQTYKNDIWNNWIGTTEDITFNGICLKAGHDFLYASCSYLGATIKNSSYLMGIYTDAPLITHRFTIDYIPIVDMFMSSNKSILPDNEPIYKDYSRTYNIGANFIDFDRANDSMQKTNDMLGLSELTLEILTNNPPFETQYIFYNNIKWYVASIIRYISTSKEYCLVSLVRNYNKVAESIGMKTQYSETKNPLENIIDRHIFFESDIPVSIRPSKTYFNIQMKNNLFKKATIMHKDNVVYLVCEADDQYSFASQIETSEKVGRNYRQIEIPYCDGYNECYKGYVSLVEIDSINKEDSLQMPIYTGARTSIIGFQATPIYKDARERLIFTIKLTNATIK